MITDSFSTFFHVSIEFPEDVSTTKARQICENACPSIRETVLTGIRKASQRLNYNNSIPKIAFPCLKHQATDLHPAFVSVSGLLTCTTHPASVCSDLTDQHQLWLGEKIPKLQANSGTHCMNTLISQSWCNRSSSPSKHIPELDKVKNCHAECVGRAEHSCTILIRNGHARGHLQRHLAMT